MKKCSYDECNKKLHKDKLCKYHYTTRVDIIKDITVENNNSYYSKQTDYELLKYKEYLIDVFDNLYLIKNGELKMVGTLENNKVFLMRNTE